MKFIKKFAVGLCMLVSAFAVVFAQSTNQPTTGTFKKLVKVKPAKKPRIPSNVFIEYMYTGSGISFLPSEYYTSLDIMVSSMETAGIWSATVSESDGYYVETGVLPSGTYSISAVTEDYVEFYGEFEI